MSMVKESKAALHLAAQAWCEDEAKNKVMDTELATAFSKILEPILEGMETAWGIIANGNWDEDSNIEWVEAAQRWQDEVWNRVVDGRLPISQKSK